MSELVDRAAHLTAFGGGERVRGIQPRTKMRGDSLDRTAVRTGRTRGVEIARRAPQTGAEEPPAVREASLRKG